jgi:hypothetical protein
MLWRLARGLVDVDLCGARRGGEEGRFLDSIHRRLAETATKDTLERSQALLEKQKQKKRKK